MVILEIKISKWLKIWKHSKIELQDLKKILGIALSHERDYDPKYNTHVDSTMESIMKGLRGIYFSIENSLSKFRGKYASEDKIEMFINELNDKIRNSGIEKQLMNDEPNKVGGIKIYLNKIIDEMFHEWFWRYRRYRWTY